MKKIQVLILLSITKLYFRNIGKGLWFPSAMLKTSLGLTMTKWCHPELVEGCEANSLNLIMPNAFQNNSVYSILQVHY